MGRWILTRNISFDAAHVNLCMLSCLHLHLYSLDFFKEEKHSIVMKRFSVALETWLGPFLNEAFVGPNGIKCRKIG
jgi:hypothetical protein